MKGLWGRGRKKPYTFEEMAKLRCVRCGDPASQQWSICADMNRHRPLCLRCDIALNRLVLEWANHPDVDTVMMKYELFMAVKYGAPRLAHDEDPARG